MNLTESRLLETQRAFVFQESRVGDFVVTPSEVDSTAKKALPLKRHRRCGRIVKKTDTFVAIAVDGEDCIIKVHNSPSSLTFDLPRVCMQLCGSISKHVLKRKTKVGEETMFVVETRSEDAAAATPGTPATPARTATTATTIIRNRDHVALAVLDAANVLPITTRAVIITLNSQRKGRKHVFVSSTHGLATLKTTRHIASLAPLSVCEATGYPLKDAAKRLAFSVLHGVDDPIDDAAQLRIMEALQ